MTIVTTTYRYKRPAKKQKAVAIEGSAIVRKVKAAKGVHTADTPKPGQAPPPPANDDRKPVIATSISRKRTRLLRAEQRTAELDDPEAAAAMRAWFERAKWGHGPAR